MKGILIGVLIGLLWFIISRSVQGPVHLWDEALYANNALDMVKHGQYLVYTVADTIDHHNTKPPLVLWMQAAAGTSLGFSELSVRLPTYLALVGVLVLLVVFLYRFTDSIFPGLLASLFCLTTEGLIRHHVFLTGDLDGVLVFWTTWITLHWIDCLRKTSVRPRDYAVLTALFYAGFLTKSTAVLLILPTLLVIGCFYWQRFKALILSYYTVGSILAFSALCSTYYLIREQYDPGYWAIVWWSEFTRLGVDVQPWLHFKWSYYFERFYDPLFQEYILLLAALLIPFLGFRKGPFKKWVLTLIAGAAAYLLFISVPPVKMEWYDAPVYPLLCAVLALVIGSLTRVALQTTSALRLVAVSVLWIVTGITIKNSFIHVAGELADEPHSGYTHQTIPDAVKIFHDRYPEIKAFNVLIPPTPARFAHHLDEITFYKNVYEHYENKTVTVSDSTVAFKVGDTIISNRELADQLATQYRLSRLDSTAGGALWVVLKTAP